MRIYRMRLLGVALSALPVASVLQEREPGTPGWLWFALLFNVLAWPHLAWWLSYRHRDPSAAEFRNLILDAAFAGFWIAAMHFSLLPSVVLVTALTADRMAAGGWKLLRWSSPAMAGACLLAWIGFGFAVEPDFSQRTMLATLPFLFGYTVALSTVAYRQAQVIARQNRELEWLNRTDPNTGLSNRRHLEARLAHEFNKHQRSGRAAALLLIDIDHFKTINDRYGHGMGDVVLKRVAEVLLAAADNGSVPARYGGDELAMLLPGADIVRAQAVAERIRNDVTALEFDAEPGLVCTVSIGFAAVARHHETLAEWIRDADGGLYRAKAAGRNRTVAA